jgi:hypothetical protein
MTKLKPVIYRYSGPMSIDVWKRINKLPEVDKRAVYGLGCVLQDVECRTLAALIHAERQFAAKKRSR